MKNYEQYIKYLSEKDTQSISVFVGAGLSKACGMPDWGELVKPYAERLGLKKTNIPYTRIMQYALQGKAEYSLFIEQLKILCEKCRPQPVHRLIARLDLPRIWTTNYDGLIESAYDDECLDYQVVANDDDIYSLNHSTSQIIKMHGSLTAKKETDIVLLEGEYENYILYRKGIYELLLNDVKTKSMIYLGFSFDDPNIRRIVSCVWSQKGTGIPSFLLTVPPHERSKKEYYRHWKSDLERYNICVLELTDYSEISTFLYRLLESRYGKTCLILGKRDDCDYNDLSYAIGYKLARAGYRIHSGGGPNIANAVARGAWEYLEENDIPIDDKVVYYYRYNGGSTNPAKGQIFYCGTDRTEVRKRMITSDKICILIGDEQPMEKGIKEEIQIAHTKGARIIPVGCTGKLAQSTWETEKYNYSSTGAFKEKTAAYEILNLDSASNEQIADAVVELADYLLVRSYEH